MPEFKYSRDTQLLNFNGIDLNRPVDSTKPNKFPYAKNIRSYVSGRIEPRLGLTNLGEVVAGQSPLHSARRLNDPLNSTYTRVLGTGTHLAYGQSFPFTDVDSGYSGDPLALVPYRPLSSPYSFMYVADRSRMRKINTSGALHTIGLAAPTTPPTVALTTARYKDVDTGQVNTGWVEAGDGAAGITAAGVTFGTITYILYDSGTTGWASIVPSVTTYLRDGAIIVFGGGIAEVAYLQYLYGNSGSTTIASIIYDSGSSGLATIALITPSPIPVADSVIRDSTTAENARVLAVVEGPNGSASIRVSTPTTWAAGDTIQVLPTFRIFTTSTHAAAETLTITNLTNVVTFATGTVTYTKTVATSVSPPVAPLLDLTSFATGVQATGDDYMYISFATSSITSLTSVKILLDVDSTLNDFTQNYYHKTFTKAQFNSTFYFVTFRFRLSELERVGTDTSRTLANVARIQIQLTCTANLTFAWNSWYIAGGYGPDTGSPTSSPYFYRYRAREKSTNVPSNFSPASLYPFDPLRQSATISLTQYAVPSGTSLALTDFVLDIERFGGEIAEWHYLATVANSASPSFTDIYSDDVVGANPTLGNVNAQPWPIKGVPVSGTTGTVSGTSVNDSGANFSLSWAPGTRININDIPYTIYRVVSTSRLEIVENAGAQSAVVWRIDEPTILAQPLACLWEWDGVFFACGDPVNPGRLYYSIRNSEGTLTTNYLDVTAPSEPLMNGVQYNIRSFLWSSDNFFQILRTGNPAQPFHVEQIPNGKGLFSRWALTREPATILCFLSKDGIYMTQGGEPTSLTDADLYPIFPNEGNPGQITNGITPPDITSANATKLRLNYYDEYLYFDYPIASEYATLIFAFDLGALAIGNAPGGWMFDQYSPDIRFHYGEEGQGVHALLMGGHDGMLYQYLGDDDDGTAIPIQFTTPSRDQGDPRSNKLFGDVMIDCDTDTIDVDATPYYNNNITAGPTTVISNSARGLVSIPCSAAAVGSESRWQTARNISLLISANVDSTSRPFFFIWEPRYTFESAPIAAASWEFSPTTFGMDNFKHIGLCKISYVSSVALRLIFTVDGVVQTAITVPTSSGVYAQEIFRVPVMKGKLYRMRLESSDGSEFRLDPRDTFIDVKPWGADVQYAALRVFGDFSMVEG